MQNKILAAAAIATSASALKLDAPTTNLAQAEKAPTALAYAECHGTYAYQCIEEKVNKTLGHMTEEVQSVKEDCLVTADDLREEIVEGVQDLRANLMKDLSDLRESQTDALNDQLRSAIENIENATDEANAAIQAEAEARVGETSAVSLARIRAQGDVKKLYYADGSGDYGAYDLKEKIVARVKEFEELLEGNTIEGNPFEMFADERIQEVEDIITNETEALNSAIDDALDTWENAAQGATDDMNAEIANKTAQMDQVIADKTDAINEIIDTLTEDFIIIFWETVEEIYRSVNYYERQGLIWKALYQKDEFIKEVSAIRDWLIQGLADTRAQLVSELNAERSGFGDFVTENRNGLVEDTNAIKAEWDEEVAESRQDMEDNYNK